MRTILIALIMTLATQVGAGETIMICDAQNSEKRYYKLNSPLLGKKSVEQKIDGKWVNWCKEYCEKIEVYDTGAMQVTVWPRIFDQDYPDWEVIAGREYYQENTYWIDFEFGTRKLQAKLFLDKARFLEKKKVNWQASTYNCEIQGK